MRALEIRLKTLPENHPDIATSYFNIGEIYHTLDKIELALAYSEKAFNIYQKIFGENYSLVIELRKTLSALHEKLNT